MGNLSKSQQHFTHWSPQCSSIWHKKHGANRSRSLSLQYPFLPDTKYSLKYFSFVCSFIIICSLRYFSSSFICFTITNSFQSGKLCIFVLKLFLVGGSLEDSSNENLPSIANNIFLSEIVVFNDTFCYTIITQCTCFCICYYYYYYYYYITLVLFVTSLNLHIKLVAPL
jgi:hypothetical protein